MRLVIISLLIFSFLFCSCKIDRNISIKKKEIKQKVKTNAETLFSKDSLNLYLSYPNDLAIDNGFYNEIRSHLISFEIINTTLIRKFSKKNRLALIKLKSSAAEYNQALTIFLKLQEDFNIKHPKTSDDNIRSNSNVNMQQSIAGAETKMSYSHENENLTPPRDSTYIGIFEKIKGDMDTLRNDANIKLARLTTAQNTNTLLMHGNFTLHTRKEFFDQLYVVYYRFY